MSFNERRTLLTASLAAVRPAGGARTRRGRDVRSARTEPNAHAAAGARVRGAAPRGHRATVHEPVERRARAGRFSCAGCALELFS